MSESGTGLFGVTSPGRRNPSTTSAFGDPDENLTMERELRSLRHRGLCSRYTSEFQRLLAPLKWNNEALMATYRFGLSEGVKDELARVLDEPRTLEELQKQAIKIDNRLYARVLERKGYNPSVRQNNNRNCNPPAVEFKRTVERRNYPSDYNGPMPMDIDGTTTYGPLGKAKKQPRFANNLCLYCGEAGHRAKNCGKQGKGKPAHLAATTSPINQIGEHLTIPVELEANGVKVKVRAMIDSGALSNFMDGHFATKIGFPLVAKSQVVPLRTIDGRPIKAGPVSRETHPKTTINALQQLCQIMFDITRLGQYRVILGAPWLQDWNPTINWNERSVCAAPSLTLAGTTQKKQVSAVAQGYQEAFIDIFNEPSDDVTLPLRSSYNHRIPLEPDTKPPWGP